MIRESTDNDVKIEIPLTFGHYTYLRTIGTGSSSVVVLARNSTTNELVACKVIHRQTLEDTRVMAQFRHAIDIQQAYHDPLIVDLREVLTIDSNIFLVMEYCEGGELISLVSDFEALPMAARHRIFSQIIRAVAFLHRNGVAHRDLKPDNILLDARHNAKLGDFGLSRRADGDHLMSTPCGSLVYTAPEILLGQAYDGFKADVWSLGVILFILETGCYPWTAKNDIALYEQITTASYAVPPTASGQTMAVIGQCLRVDPAGRPTAAELIQQCGARPPRVVAPLGHARTIAVPSRALLQFTTVARSADHRRRLRLGSREGDSSSALPTLNQRASKSGRALEW
jgi:serine/threonine protein kinase